MWEVSSQGTLTPAVPPPQSPTVGSCTHVITWSLDTAAALCECSGRFAQHRGEQHGATDVITKSGRSSRRSRPRCVTVLTLDTAPCPSSPLPADGAEEVHGAGGGGTERSRRSNKLCCGGQTLMDVVRIAA